MYMYKMEEVFIGSTNLPFTVWDFWLAHKFSKRLDIYQLLTSKLEAFLQKIVVWFSKNMKKITLYISTNAMTYLHIFLLLIYENTVIFEWKLQFWKWYKIVKLIWSEHWPDKKYFWITPIRLFISWALLIGKLTLERYFTK